MYIVNHNRQELYLFTVMEIIDQPLSELLVEQTIGEALTADSDSFQDTITPELVQNKMSVNDSRSFELIGNDATDKVGCCVTEGCHQFAQ